MLPYVTFVEERLGDGWNDLEILAWINDTFRISVAFVLSILTKTGKFAIQRHPCNAIDRGDAGSVASKQTSVETFGLRPEWRGPPFLVQHPDEAIEDEFLSLSWGTLFQGTEKAYLADTQKKNKLLQASLASVISGCSVYRRGITRDAASWLVMWRNKKKRRQHDHEPSRDMEVYRFNGVSMDAPS